MALTGVTISDEVWMSCLVHALSTETEEVMGLLLGDIVEDKIRGTVDALVWGAVPQARSDRRKDRVEATPEQMTAATALAEKISKTTGNTTRVIGWYHSHPHITVLPSHVDLRTQGLFQLLDRGFVGIIFSCFNEDANMVGRIQSIAFQSVVVNQRAIPVREESASQHSNDAFHYNFERSPAEEGALALINVEDDTPHRDLDDEHGQQLSPSMQQAMHLSSLDMSSGEFSRKEIPIKRVPVSAFKLVNPPPDPLFSLQQMLSNEEKAAFEQAMRQSKQGQRIHPLGVLHHCVTYQASLCKLMEFCLMPAMGILWDELQQNKIKLSMLQLADNREALVDSGRFSPISQQKEVERP